jgi:hypothetical protein
MRDETFDLICELNDLELQDRALQMSSVVIRTDEVEAQKKDAMKGFTEELGSLRGEMRRLSGVIRNRCERRAVMCAVMFHKPVQGTKRIVRRDTGDIVRDEPMTAFEMQDNLFDPPSVAEAEQVALLPVEDDEVASSTEQPNGFDRQE